MFITSSEHVSVRNEAGSPVHVAQAASLELVTAAAASPLRKLRVATLVAVDEAADSVGI